MGNAIKTFLVMLVVLSGCAPANTAKTAAKEAVAEDPSGRSLPFHTVSLANLKDFRNPKNTGWQVAGEASADRNKENNLEISKGNGVLVYLPGTKNKGNLLTSFDHGDMDLEFDFMMPKGSASGILLQGRYELRLTDSWLKDLVTGKDSGGINAGTGNGNDGHAPLVNAAKAPGLWQHAKIRFIAPTFDQAGNKVSNARFDYVYLNEAVVQQQVEVSGPGPGAVFGNEQAAGPLVLPGGQGPIAFKDIKYKTYHHKRLKLDNIALKVFKIKGYNLDTLRYLKPDAVKPVDSISHDPLNGSEKGVFQASLQVPEAGEYLFVLRAAGPGRLAIDGKLVTDNHAALDIMGYYSYDKPGYGKVYLTPGPHDVELIFAKRHGNLTLSYEGPGIPVTELSAHSSGRQIQAMEPYLVPVKKRPVMQRGFWLKDEIKLRHVISVGIPGGINYAYDLNNYSLITAWHGSFIDAAPMWRSRGNPQLMLPLGGMLNLLNQPTLAMLPSDQAVWPDSVQVDANVFTNRGYKVSASGLPAFFYSIDNADVEDQVYPSADNKGLTREITLNFKAPVQNLYCRIASGKKIEKLADGSYAVDGRNYYLDQLETSGNPPVIRTQKERQSLIIPLRDQGKQVIKYSVIW